MPFKYLFYFLILAWLSGIILIYAKKKIAGLLLIVVGILFFTIFIYLYWSGIERAPMKTLGETRIWYAFFLSIIGFILFLKWKYKWLMSYSLLLALFFLLINYLTPSVFDKELAPALQSFWFIPHVLVYLFAYALLGASFIMALHGLWLKSQKRLDMSLLHATDNTVFLGFGFLTLGLIFGGFWAKEAWGHYWTWDPKETWALITWVAYLIYIHIRIYHPSKIKTHLLTLTISFILLLICWFGVNYLASGANSVHTYGS